jgi:hypothetical protein
MSRAGLSLHAIKVNTGDAALRWIELISLLIS